MPQPFRMCCQTITFGDKQNAHFPEVLRDVAAAGYESAEIGYRHLHHTEGATVKGLLDKYNLTLMAVHISGNMLETPSVKGKGSLFDDMIAFTTATGTKTCFYSGLLYEDPAKFERNLKVVQRTAQACLDHGMRLYYHNHDWEFDHEARIMDALIALRDPAVELCLDVGWAVKGGADVLTYLERVKPRVAVLHAKDFSSGKSVPRVADIVGLGDGIVPFPQIAQMFKDNGRSMWVVAEQDFARLPAAEAVAANARYLRKVFGFQNN